jgi:3-oxoacyl-[acyl-carrier protein] reductase
MMLDNSLDGEVAFVTGGAAGIGAAIVEALVTHGASVAVLDVAPLDPSRLDRLGDRIDRVRGWIGDVGSSGAIDNACTQAEACFGPISILVNNAGGCGSARCTGILDISDDGWDEVMALNLAAIMRCSRRLVPGMQRLGRGRIINIGSSLMHGQKGGAGTAPALLPYVAAKSGIVGLTRQLAFDLGADGITVNGVVPGLTLPDPESKLAKRFQALPQAEQDRLSGMVPLGRLGTGSDIANAVCFFASPASAYVTGEMLTVAGGA